MPRRDGEGLVVTFDTLELAALLDGFLRGGIDAAGGLGEDEGRGAHNFIFFPSFADSFPAGTIACASPRQSLPTW